MVLQQRHALDEPVLARDVDRGDAVVRRNVQVGARQAQELDNLDRAALACEVDLGMGMGYLGKTLYMRYGVC